MDNQSGEYERANLGSDQRNQKFLRLMGGGKKPGLGNVPHAMPAKPQPVEEYKPEEPEVQRKEDVKDEEEETALSVHSANKWENAELGDTGRKNKFLRLMGAARSSDSATEDSPAKTERKGYDKAQLEKDLEQQYQQGLEFRLSGGARKHRGFGFVEEPPAPKESEGGDSNQTEGSQTGDAQRQENRDNQNRERSDFRRDGYDYRRDRAEQGRDYARDRSEHRRDREDYRRNDDDFRRNRDDYRRDREDYGTHRDDRSRHRDDFRRSRDDYRRDKREYKSDPSEYGRVPRDSRQQSYNQQGYGPGHSQYESNVAPNVPPVHYPQGQTYQQTGQQPQWSQQYPAQTQPVAQGYNWSQPPPPPPPEPGQASNPQHSYQAPHYYGSQQGTFTGQNTYSGSQTGYNTQLGYQQPQSYSGGAPPPSQSQTAEQPAFKKYQPMTFVKSSDS